MTTGLVAIVKNEASILAEWLAFHRVLGFDRIHILDNESTDDTPHLLRQAASHVDGITAETWPSGGDFVDCQRLAYDRGLQIMRAEGVEWCLFIDADEFITCTTDETLAQFLLRRDANAAIALHWSFYGSGGHEAEPPGLVIENYLLRAPAHFEPQRLCKSLVRVPYVQGCVNAHGFSLDPQNFPYVDCEGAPVLWEPQGQDRIVGVRHVARTAGGEQSEPHGPNHLIAPWRLNHYFVRSRAWWQKKVARSNAAPGFVRHANEWDMYDRNDFLDLSAAKHGQAVREELLRMGFERPAMPDWADPQLAEPARRIRGHIETGATDGFGTPPPSAADIRHVPQQPAGPAPSVPASSVNQALGNVALGKRATQSSISAWSRKPDLYDDAMGAVSGVIDGGYGFHTDADEGPWWMVDLAECYEIAEIRVFNRLDVPHRARNLSIWTSLSAKDWRHVYSRTDPHDFGGADGNPLRIVFHVPPAARFVRLELSGKSVLHLDEVEIYSRSPPRSQPDEPHQ